MKIRALVLLCSSLVIASTLGAACSNSGEVGAAGGAVAGTTGSGSSAGNGSGSSGSAGSGAAPSGGSSSGAVGNTGGGTAGVGAAAGSDGGGSVLGCGDRVGLGAACSSTADCCTGLCGLDGHCALDISACGEEGADCSNATQCCSFSCTAGTCGAGTCTADGEACTADSECCGGTCKEDGTCLDLNDLTGFVFPPTAKKESMDPVCKTSGNPCGEDLDCCSGLCGDDGTCSRGSSFCVQAFDICAADADCCQGVCAKADGASVGICANRVGAGTRCDNMLIGGEVCGGDCSLCCSRSCAPFGESGTFICQPPSGCRPEGELCQQDVDCCGGDSAFTAAGNQGGFCDKEPGEAVGRCSKTGCTPHGAICGYDILGDTSCDKNISAPQGTSCCQPSGGGKENLCDVDSLLIPRCNSLSECVEAGASCGTSDDCCGGLPCVQEPNGTGGFVCYDPPGEAACVSKGGPCTNDGDCCVGTSCQLSAGQATGSCGSLTSPPSSGTGGGSGTGGTSGTGGGSATGGSAGSGSGGASSSCAFYGQSCTQSSDCCNNVPCDTSITPSICRFSAGG